MSSTSTRTKAAAASGKDKVNGGNPKKNPNNRQRNVAVTKQRRLPQASAAKPNSNPPKRPPPLKLDVDPPLECSRTDFEALLGDAAGLVDVEEASEELLDCARHGETDACRAILDVWLPREVSHVGVGGDGGGRPPRVVDAKDATHSTPLHRACANGHLLTARLLLARGALHLPNDSGNTPLHWAAGRGRADCVGLLLDHFDALAALDHGNGRERNKPLDVLLKNDFGRSALTEGFSSGDTETIERLLNHDSAEEERLIGGLDKKEVDDESDPVDGANEGEDGKKEKGKEEKSVVHEFDFSVRDAENEVAKRSEVEGPKVMIRELPITHADDPFGRSPVEDTTGLGIWCASIVMSRWMASSVMVERMRNKNILELGAGCGVPALTAAVHGTPHSVSITDLNPETIDNLQHNIELNRKRRDDSNQGDNANNATAAVTASSIDWGNVSTYPAHRVDYVICSDCIYQKEVAPLLQKVVTGLLRPDDGGYFLYVAPAGGRDGLPEFIASMKQSGSGFKCVREEVAPDAYRENPLTSGDDDDCFLHFHELASTEYVLYEFRRC